MDTVTTHYLERRGAYGVLDVTEFRVRGESVTVVTRVGRRRTFVTMPRSEARRLYARLRKQGFQRW